MTSDSDGLTDGEEAELGTDPLKADTDEDGLNDDKDGWPTEKLLKTAYLLFPNYVIASIGSAAPGGINKYENVVYASGGQVYYGPHDGPVVALPEHDDIYGSSPATAAVGIIDLNRVYDTGSWYEEDATGTEYATPDFTWQPGGNLQVGRNTFGAPGQFTNSPLAPDYLGASSEYHIVGITPVVGSVGSGWLSGSHMLHYRSSTIWAPGTNGAAIPSYVQGAFAHPTNSTFEPSGHRQLLFFPAQHNAKDIYDESRSLESVRRVYRSGPSSWPPPRSVARPLPVCSAGFSQRT